ncbi:hypothetical protein BASA81_012398 [Batrachochytrium salamandrivorans]|nr:hypothetical protein BASA81_012398 [Batrachochytrium salamandrivorans]
MWLLLLAVGAGAVVDESELFCPAPDFSRPKLYSDQAAYDSAPFITIHPQFPMKQTLWWAVTTYEQYYSDEYAIRKHIPHFDASMQLTPELFQSWFRAHAQPVIIPFASLRGLEYKTRTWEMDELLAEFPTTTTLRDDNGEGLLRYKANELNPEELDLGLAVREIYNHSALKKSKQGMRNFPRNSFMRPNVLRSKLGYDRPPLGINLAYDTLWFGSSSLTSDTPLHHDGGDNFLTMITGTKLISLVPPSDWRLLNPRCGKEGSKTKPNAGEGLCFSTTTKDPTDTRESASDLLRVLNVITFELKQGEILYLPAGWFHAVKNLGPTVMINNWAIFGRDMVGLIRTMMDEDEAN